MKGIFSKSGNKKEMSGKMDRRGIQNHSVSSMPQGSIPQQRVVNSFIPTSLTYGQSHSNNSNGHNNPKPVPSATAIIHQQQQQHHNQIPNGGQQNSNHYYSNVPGNHAATLGAIATRHYQHSVHHNNQHSSQQVHQRTLTKSYSSNNNQQSHYGNTTGHVGNNNQNQNPYYGNASNLTNGTLVMNGHHTGEKNIVNSQYNNPPLINQVQHTYSHQQAHHQQVIHQLQNVQQQSNQKIHQIQQISQYQTSTNNTITNVNATEGLPITLVESMRTLFDILDDTKEGKIRLSDIETRWENDSNGSNGKSSGAEPLIKMGVLEYLRKVTPSDGMLTFDRFCSGLRLALLTNNNESSMESSLQNHSNSEKYQIHNPPQQYFQEHVKIISQSSKMQGPHQNTSQPHFNAVNNNNLGIKSNSAVQLPHAGQSNTIHRMSKIPNISASRLPMLNGGVPSGIPLSPTNRGNGYVIPNGGIKNMPNNHVNHHSTGTLRRYPMNSEHNTSTTIALVHPQPPPNPKPGVGLVQPTSYSSNNGTLKMTKQISTSGFQNRFSRNNSLDDLKVPNAELMQQNMTPKDRPPSAPILDADANDNLDENENHTLPQKRLGRERAKSQERDRLVNGHGNHQSRAEEKSNFVKTRQRTLSMPQLQLNKLKPKSSEVNFEESPPEKVIPSSLMDNSYPRSNALKNSGHSTSKLIPGPSVVSSIPTMSSTHSIKYSKGDISHNMTSKESYNNRNEKESPEILTPPPPKPPRNASGPGPVTISNNSTNDPPLSNSSFGSVQTQSSSATLSQSTTSSVGGNSTNKPSEIRTVLHSWQKSMTDKKPVEQSLSVTSIGTNSSINTNDTTKSAPPTGTTMVNKEKVNENNEINRTSGDEVKLKPNKSNLKRKDTARRHTVQSGIDFTALKRLKQLEQERDVLQQGLSYLQKTHEWYIKQLEIAEDKIGLLNKGAPTADYWSESHEERLNLLGCRVSEVNSLLTALMDGSSRLPLHMNLQIPSHLSLRTITRLKDQNRQLTHEVSDYSHRVTQLENEKAMLLRQLFHQKNSSASDETVYM